MFDSLLLPMPRLLFWVLEIFTILMMIDCAIHRRDIYWFFILLVLGPLGGVIYAIYYFDQVTFPFRLSTLRGATSKLGPAPRPSGRRCPRCQQPAAVLKQFEDGRGLIYLCNTCWDEMTRSRQS